MPTVDYYALAGYLHSTAMREAVIDSPERAAAIAAAHDRIEEANLEIHKILTAASAWPAPAPMRLREGETLFTASTTTTAGPFPVRPSAAGRDAIRRRISR